MALAPCHHPAVRGLKRAGIVGVNYGLAEPLSGRGVERPAMEGWWSYVAKCGASVEEEVELRSASI